MFVTNRIGSSFQPLRREEERNLAGVMAALTPRFPNLDTEQGYVVRTSFEYEGALRWHWARREMRYNGSRLMKGSETLQGITRGGKMSSHPILLSSGSRCATLSATRPTRNHDRDVAGWCRGFSLKTSFLYPWHVIPHSKYRHEKETGNLVLERGTDILKYLTT